MGVEENKARFARVIDELLNRKNLAALDELVDPGFRDGYTGFDRERYGAFLRELVTAFPDLEVEVEDVVGEEDTIVARLRLAGTHAGPFLGVAATGRHVSFASIGWVRFRDGRMVARWNVWDAHGVLERLSAP